MRELINDWFSFRNVTNPFEIIEKTEMSLKELINERD
jgi:hypothetical protein